MLNLQKQKEKIKELKNKIKQKSDKSQEVKQQPQEELKFANQDFIDESIVSTRDGRIMQSKCLWQFPKDETQERKSLSKKIQTKLQKVPKTGLVDVYSEYLLFRPSKLQQKIEEEISSLRIDYKDIKSCEIEQHTIYQCLILKVGDQNATHKITNVKSHHDLFQIRYHIQTSQNSGLENVTEKFEDPKEPQKDEEEEKNLAQIVETTQKQEQKVEILIPQALLNHPVLNQIVSAEWPVVLADSQQLDGVRDLRYLLTSLFISKNAKKLTFQDQVQKMIRRKDKNVKSIKTTQSPIQELTVEHEDLHNLLHDQRQKDLIFHQKNEVISDDATFDFGEHIRVFHRSQITTSMLYKPKGIYKKLCYLEHIYFYMVSHDLVVIHSCIHSHKPLPFTDNFRAEIIMTFFKNQGAVYYSVKCRLVFLKDNSKIPMAEPIKKQIEKMFDNGAVKHFSQYIIPCLHDWITQEYSEKNEHVSYGKGSESQDQITIQQFQEFIQNKIQQKIEEKYGDQETISQKEADQILQNLLENF